MPSSFVTSCGDAEGLQRTAKAAEDAGVANIAVLCHLLLHDLKPALQVLVKANRLPEAAFFARTYIPSELPAVCEAWRADLKSVNEQLADALADPKNHLDLFPDFSLTLDAEAAFAAKRQQGPVPAAKYLQEKDSLEMSVLDEIRELGLDGFKKKLLGGGSVEKVQAAVPEATPVVSKPVVPGPEMTGAPPDASPAPAPEASPPEAAASDAVDVAPETQQPAADDVDGTLL